MPGAESGAKEPTEIDKGDANGKESLVTTEVADAGAAAAGDALVT